MKLSKNFTNPLAANNPVIVQILGICSALAVTVKLEPAFVMGLSVTFVCAFSNLIMSLLRNGVPSRIRMYDVSKQLSVYVGLIITNCIVMGRVEAFALGNKPWDAFVDGVANGLGYAFILVLVAFFRELFGSGTLFGFDVIARFGYVNNSLMLFPPMALIIVGVIIWVHRSINKDLQEK